MCPEVRTRRPASESTSARVCRVRRADRYRRHGLRDCLARSRENGGHRVGTAARNCCPAGQPRQCDGFTARGRNTEDRIARRVETGSRRRGSMCRLCPGALASAATDPPSTSTRLSLSVRKEPDRTGCPATRTEFCAPSVPAMAVPRPDSSERSHNRDWPSEVATNASSPVGRDGQPTRDGRRRRGDVHTHLGWRRDRTDGPTSRNGSDQRHEHQRRIHASRSRCGASHARATAASSGSASRQRIVESRCAHRRCRAGARCDPSAGSAAAAGGSTPAWSPAVPASRALAPESTRGRRTPSRPRTRAGRSAFRRARSRTTRCRCACRAACRAPAPGSCRRRCPGSCPRASPQES